MRRSFIIALLIILTLSSCGGKRDNQSNQEKSYSSSETDEHNIDEKFPDDTYCAEVEYYNPNTGTHSSYTLTVEVESNEVTKINFPNGGWMDTDHFSDSELDENGNSSFTSDKGYEYEIKIISRSSNCFTSEVPRAVQCRGVTEDGERCEHLTDNANGLCWQHQDQE